MFCSVCTVFGMNNVIFYVLLEMGCADIWGWRVKSFMGCDVVFYIRNLE